MKIRQLSVFVENKGGKLAQITSILAANEINILALSIADTTDFGILRIIVEDADKAYSVLKEAGVMVKSTDVVVIALENKPGSLNKVLGDLNEGGLQIEYMYHFSNQTEANESMLVLRLNNQERALEVLNNAGVKVMNADVVKGL